MQFYLSSPRLLRIYFATKHFTPKNRFWVLLRPGISPVIHPFRFALITDSPAHINLGDVNDFPRTSQDAQTDDISG